MSKPEPTTADFPRKFGKYHLLAPLAQGGMGALYLAVTGDTGFERLMCIKTVLPQLADKEYIARFRDEAKIVVQLSHGNLIPVFDAGLVSGEMFLAMDFVKGKDLRAVWNRCAKKAVAFPVDVAVHLTKELCRGLGYAHNFQDIALVHRDVSPPNVLVSYSGEVKLTDFGLASSTLKMEKTLPGIVYGKVAYMSPEQARGETLDGRSDVYAAGIILWELLTGRQLFPPGDALPQDLLVRARDPEVATPSSKAPRVPAELDAVVMKALCGDRDERYQSAEEFRDALGTWLAANHPSTDTARVKSFVGQLFEEDMVAEEAERSALMQRTRDRMSTLPPTEELRTLLNSGGSNVREALQKVADRRQDEEGDNFMRRGLDHGEDLSDRREVSGRRLLDSVERSQRRVVVDVPKAGPGGKTLVAGSHGGSGVTAAEAIEDSPNFGPADILGQVVENRYQVSTLIGEGGMGKVYLAEHIDIGKKVAIKVLHPVYGRMPDLVERFRREARAATRIGHPNIVDVTDSGTTKDGSVYFVMEYLEGVELAAVIEREGSMDMRRAIDISTQVCRALSAAHAVGIIHRDLKPENVFLTSREGTADFVKVLDFGIAKSSEAEEARAKKLTSPGMAMGTPEYMAPEQAAGKPADERCDVYALGAILYEMLTGTPPYTGDNFMEILTRKATEEPVPPRALCPDIPEVVEELILRAMSRSPDGRPPSMDAFEYELTKCLAGRGVAVANILGISQEDGFEGASGFDTSVGVVMTPAPGSLSADSNLASGNGFPRSASTGARGLRWGLIGGGVALLVLVLLVLSRGSSDPEPQGDSLLQKAAPQNIQDSLSEQSSRKPEQGRSTNSRDVRTNKAASTANAGQAGDAESVRSGDLEASLMGAELGADAQEPTALSIAPTKEVHPKIRRNGPPYTLKEAQALLRQAKSLVEDTKWDAARTKYQRVASGTFLRHRGYLGLSYVAFQNKNANLAIKYAKKAGGSAEAQMALGNGYYSKLDYQNALKIYNKVLAKNPGNTLAQASAKAAREHL